MTIPPLGPGAEPPYSIHEEEVIKFIQRFSHEPCFPIIDLPFLERIPTPGVCDRPNPPNSITLDPNSQNSENIEKMNRLAQTCNNLTHFIRHHPLLTSGLVAGILFILSAAALTTAVALNHTSLHILGADIPLNLELSAVLVYQGVFLVNMARRGALKDELELKIKKLNQDPSNLVEARKNMQEYLSKVTIGESYYRQARKMRRETFNLLREEYEQAILNRMLLNQNSNLLKTLSPGEISLVKEADKIIRQGFDPIDLPETPEISELFITLPDHPTDKNLKNQEMATSIGEKLAALFKENAPLFLRTKTSKFISFSGLAFLALSGIGIYFWLKGITGIPLFEHLGIGVLVPMAVYGVALFYEGYNSGLIDFLEKQKQALSHTSTVEDEKRLQEEKERIDRVITSAKEKLEKFHEEWGRLQTTEEMIFDLAKRQFALFSQLSEEKFVRNSKELIAQIAPSSRLDLRRAVDFLSAPASGMRLITILAGSLNS